MHSFAINLQLLAADGYILIIFSTSFTVSPAAGCLLLIVGKSFSTRKIGNRLAIFITISLPLMNMIDLSAVNHAIKLVELTVHWNAASFYEAELSWKEFLWSVRSTQ